MDPVVVKKGLAAINTIASVIAAAYFAEDVEMKEAVVALVALLVQAALVAGWVLMRRPGDLGPLPKGAGIK